MRRVNWVFLVVVLIVIAVVEYYTFSALRFVTRNIRTPYKQILLGVYIFITLAWFIVLLMTPSLRNAPMSKPMRNFLISFSMGFLITKVLIAAILLLDDIRRLAFSALYYSGVQKTEGSFVQKGISRSDFMVQFALLFGGTIFGSMLYGMTNRYRYQVQKLSLHFSNLPEAFRKLRIVQISDIHTGSLNNLKAVAKGVEMINGLKPDIILFTGDLVNNVHSEALEFMPVFSKLQAPLGVYSVLGNHDYGDYIDWNSRTEKEENLNQLKKIHADMGWNLLLDEHVVLQRGEETLALLGVQNTSFKNRFHTYGNLEKAYTGAASHPFKILMSHDPSHWDGEVNQKYPDIDLTLSGHTHGFQFGVDIPWLKWSPVQYIYKQWAGLYQKNDQYLYVNRGFGFLGYPGRVGILPEITLIELT